MQIRRILCPVDFGSPTRAGLAEATSIATEYGAELTLLHVLDFPFAGVAALPAEFDLESYYAEMTAEAHLQMAGLIDADAADYMEVKTRVERGVPYAEIARVCNEDGYDFLVMPTHGRDGLGRLLHGSTSEKVVRMVRCPVLSVHPQDAPAFKPDPIVCAIDFSDGANAALGAACHLAARYDAELILLHIVTLWDYNPSNPSWRFPALPDEYRAAVAAGPQAQLETVRDQCELDVTAMLVNGYDAAEDIVRVANDVEAGLLVMGTHGHTGLVHGVLGSVANKAMRGFEGPVLTVRQDPS